jgi:hypothetical protein
MVDYELDFHGSRYKAMVKINTQLENDLRIKTSEYNILKKQHLEFLHEAADDKINRAAQFIKLKQKVKFLKDQVGSLKQELLDREKHCEMYHSENETN